MLCGARRVLGAVPLDRVGLLGRVGPARGAGGAARLLAGTARARRSVAVAAREVLRGVNSRNPTAELPRGLKAKVARSPRAAEAELFRRTMADFDHPSMASAGDKGKFRAKLDEFKNRLLGRERAKRKRAEHEEAVELDRLAKRPRGWAKGGAAPRLPKAVALSERKGLVSQGAAEPKSGGSKRKDPSEQYLKAPLRAPVCREAASFFRDSAGFKSRFEIRVGPVKGWRTTAKLSVRGMPPKIGLFAPGSHDVVVTLDSAAHHPNINRVVQLVSEAMGALGARGYSGTKPGGCSYLCANVERASGGVQLVLVYNSPQPLMYAKEVEEITDWVLKKLGPGKAKVLHSVWLHCNPAQPHENNIYCYDANAWHQLYGQGAFLEERLASNKGGDALALPVAPTLYFSPYVFRQANPEAFADIVREIRNWVDEDTKEAVELYAGVGTIGLHLVDRVQRLFCSDDNPHNQECFQMAERTLPKSLRKRATYRSASATEVVQAGALDTAELLVVDPPRKGLEEQVVAKICESPSLKRLVYVSCGFKAFQRDCLALLERGWRVVHAQGFLLFPGANHIETLAVFERGATLPIRGVQSLPAWAASRRTSAGRRPNSSPQ